MCDLAPQYYNFLRLGRDGFTRIQQACRDTAQWLSSRISEMDAFELVSDGTGIPVFAFRIAVRNGFGHELARKLIEDLERVVGHLSQGRGAGAPHKDSFHH